MWSFPASLLVNLFVTCVAHFFFAHVIYCLCRRQAKRLVVVPIILAVLAHFGFGMEAVILMIIDNNSNNLTQIRFHAAIPCGASGVLSEVLITASLCILFYDGSRSAFPRTKRLLDTLIIYAVNRCLLTLLVTIAELIVNVDRHDAWTMGLDFIIGKLYTNSLLASLNTREYLRSKASGAALDLRKNAVHFTSLPKLLENGVSENDG